jgi:BirA family biotin operon repressor/biotin-[acetyl-CoA-carboxylase] ligase
VKWPNDILAGGRKLGGVLVEGRLRGAEVSSLVVGLGINVRDEDLPPAIADRATSLRMLGCADLDRASLAAALLAAIGAAADRFVALGLTPFMCDLAARDVLKGSRVDVGGVSGVADGIDVEGRLLIRRDDGSLSRVVSGEVTIG